MPAATTRERSRATALRGLAAMAVVQPGALHAADNPAEAVELQHVEVIGTSPLPGLGTPRAALKDWAVQQTLHALAGQCDAFAALSQSGLSRTLPGPTGERNTYRLLPRETALSLADSDADRLCQLAAALAVGCALLWPDDDACRKLHARLPATVRARISLTADWQANDARFDTVLHHGDSDQLRAVCEQVARRAGPIVGVIGLARGETAVPLERLLIERAISVNTAAAGGNASLMTIG